MEPVDLKAVNKICEHILPGFLGIQIVELTDSRVKATMPVTEKTHQPMGLLHGGASVALAETIASLGGWHLVAKEGKVVVGLEINANHLKKIRTGTVTGTGVPLHLGKTTQVWEIRIEDAQNNLICVSRCTLAVINL